MMSTIMLYLILTICAIAVLTPIVFAIVDRRFYSNHIKTLNARVECSTCHNYKAQSDMYFSNQCFDCFDIMAIDHYSGPNGVKDG